jgi:hypothetical protein
MLKALPEANSLGSFGLVYSPKTDNTKPGLSLSDVWPNLVIIILLVATYALFNNTIVSCSA